MLRQFDWLISDPGFSSRGHFTTLAPMGWEDCTPLQAADLLAYENMKDAERRLDNRTRRKTLELIIEEGDTGFRTSFIDTKNIEAMKPFLEFMELPKKNARRKKMKPDSEYDNFNNTMKKILSVSKEELQRRLEAEKAAKDKAQGKRI
jgi:hypothetical protein